MSHSFEREREKDAGGKVFFHFFLPPPPWYLGGPFMVREGRPTPWQVGVPFSVMGPLYNRPFPPVRRNVDETATTTSTVHQPPLGGRDLGVVVFFFFRNVVTCESSASRPRDQAGDNWQF